MKKSIALFLGIIMIFAFVALAVAGTSGGVAPSVGKVNVPLTVPKPDKSVCKNLTAGKAGTATFDVSATTMVNWKSFASRTDTTAVTLERRFNSNAAGTGMPGSTESNLPIGAGVSNLVFGKYSAADNSVTPRVCVDLN